MKDEAVVRPQVYYDLDELAAWIQSDSPDAALRFLNQAEATFQALAEMPGLGGPYATQSRRLKGLRCFAVRGFPNHLIFYLPISGGVEIVRVLHGARDIAPILEAS
jgi:toxin ParE1/3/4